jgi:hypothetical protein
MTQLKQVDCLVRALTITILSPLGDSAQDVKDETAGFLGHAMENLRLNIPKGCLFCQCLSRLKLNLIGKLSGKL